MKKTKTDRILSIRRDPRILTDVCQILMVVKHKNPELRIMQILGNVYGNIDPYYIEDDDLLVMLQDKYDA